MSVFAIIVLSLLVTRLATMTLEVTGMSRDSARYQARSALTGSGFTTSESETIVNHPVRRRVIMRLMLIGSAGVVTVIASLILSFRGGSADAKLIKAGILIGGLGAVWWISRLDCLEARDYARLLDLSGDHGVAELQVRGGDWVVGRPLRALRLRDEGILVLGIRRRQCYIGVPGPHTCVSEGDVLVLYGRSARVAELDGRRTGPTGDVQHEQARADQERVSNAENAEVERIGRGA